MPGIRTRNKTTQIKRVLLFIDLLLLQERMIGNRAPILNPPPGIHK
jgi:hypothetical protein